MAANVGVVVTATVGGSVVVGSVAEVLVVTELKLCHDRLQEGRDSPILLFLFSLKHPTYLCL